MNEEPHIIPDTTHELDATPARRFPVALQLGVLLTLLITLFAAAGGTAVTFMGSLKEEVGLPTNSPVATSAEAAFEDTSPHKVPEDIRLTADAAYVWDVVGQRVLYQKNADTVLPLASITKLMTALIAYELVEDNLTVTIPGTATRQESASGLASGEQFNVRRLADMALTASANDAAYSLGAAVGSLLGDNDNTAQFIAAMNIRAEELGLASLSFKNTTGLDLTSTEAGAMGNARDISFLMEYILTQHPDLLKSTTEESLRVYNTAGDYHDVENTNVLVGRIPNLIGSKTGYTDLAGGNLTIAYDAGFNRPVIVTVLSSSVQGRFIDVAALVEAVSSGTIE